MDIRYQLAEDVAEQIGAQLYPGRCPDCQHPLLIKPDQGMPFCWFCVTDRMAAQRARTALTKARMAAQGIIIEEYREPRHILRPDEDEENGRWWPEGMPL